LKDFAIFVAVGALIFGVVHNNTAALMAWFRGALVKVPAWVKAQTGAKAPAVITIPRSAPMAVGVVTPGNPADTITVLDPAKAVLMTQSEVYNAYFMNYLKSLSKAALLAWQSVYVRAGSSPKNADGTLAVGGSWLYDPFGVEVAGQSVHVLPGTPGAMVLVTDAAATNLAQLAILGAPVICGVPGQ
jgi:hypothetical protein